MQPRTITTFHPSSHGSPAPTLNIALSVSRRVAESHGVLLGVCGGRTGSLGVLSSSYRSPCSARTWQRMKHSHVPSECIRVQKKVGTVRSSRISYRVHLSHPTPPRPVYPPIASCLLPILGRLRGIFHHPCPHPCPCPSRAHIPVPASRESSAAEKSKSV